MSKRLWLIIALAAIVAVFFAIIFLGTDETKVNVLDDRVQIKGIYGTEFYLSEITGVTMIEKSMDEIGIGDNINSYSVTNGYVRGRFNKQGVGEILVFVEPKIAPTLWIEIAGKEDIFISYSDGRKTEWIYREIKAAINPPA